MTLASALPTRAQTTSYVTPIFSTPFPLFAEGAKDPSTSLRASAAPDGGILVGGEWTTSSQVLLPGTTRPGGQAYRASTNGDADSLDSDSLPDSPGASATAPSLADAPAASLPAAPVPKSLTMSDEYEPITVEQRFVWIAKATLGYPSLIGGLFSAGIGTAWNHPHEDGTHWGGFGERYGIRLTGVATSNVMEAGMGAIWGEDPRYFRVKEGSFREHARNVIKQTIYARRRDGDFQFAYARAMGIFGSNFLSNTWRADSEADASHAMLRVAEGYGAKALSNGWAEFWPPACRRVFHRCQD